VKLLLVTSLLALSCGPAAALGESVPAATADPHAIACAAAKTAAQTEVTRCRILCPEGGRCCPIYMCSTVALDNWRSLHDACSDGWAPLWPESTTGVTDQTCETLYKVPQATESS
jgi:hypothetical protein